MNEPYAALEIGTTRTVLAIGERAESGRLQITAHAEIPSTGVRKSQILDINQATQSIRAVLQQIERKADEQGNRLSLANVYLVVDGQHVRADPFAGVTQVSGERVEAEDIRDVQEKARGMTLSRDRELLDIAEQGYALDALSGITSPRGMSGRILKLNALHVHGYKDRIANARTAAEGAHLEVTEPLFAATCAADAVLEEHERRNGALVLDLGGGSTGYAAYADGYLVATGSIGVGGDHVTNDIAHAFQATQFQAETLKVTEASAVLSAAGADARVKLPGSTPLMETHTVSRRALDTVVNARLRELFAVIRETLEAQDLLARLHGGVVLTGGGAAQKGLAELAEREFGLSARLGRLTRVDPPKDVAFTPGLAAIAGALLYAQRAEESDGGGSGLSSIFRRVFS